MIVELGSREQSSAGGVAAPLPRLVAAAAIVACASVSSGCAALRGVPRAGDSGGDVVSARVVTLRIPTYAGGASDPMPRLFEDEGIYPYAMLDDVGRARRAQPREYRAVVLENRTTRVIVVPALGGKIYAAHDKTNGDADFVYHNHVVKPALVALRGAWVSGGVEWNFPSFGHSVNTYSPVPFALQRHADGSASVVVGTTEWARRMRWTVRIRLYPGRSYVHHRARLVNPTPYHRRAYYWVNAAVHARRGTRVILPTNTFFFGERTAKPQPWPGKSPDRSYYRKVVEPTDHFSAIPSSFIAAYHEGLDRGTAHFAARRQSAGKKFFTWGTAREGAMWEPLLTDRDGKYIELQSGRLLSQHDTWLMEPRAVEVVEGYWYALRGIGGVDTLNREAALRVVRRGARGLRVGVNTTRRHERATLALVARGGRVLRSERVRVGPAAPLSREMVLPAAAGDGQHVQVMLRAADGRVLIARSLVAPSYPAARRQPRLDAKARDAQSLYRRARRALLEWRRPEALALLRKALKAAPQHVPSRRLLGELLVVGGAEPAGLSHLSAALARDERDTRARYYRALARLAGGDRRGARADLARTAARAGYRAPSLLLAACEALSRGALRDGRRLLWSAARSSSEHSARVLLAAQLARDAAAGRRAVGGHGPAWARRRARALLARVLRDDPLHPGALLESAMQRGGSAWSRARRRLGGDAQLSVEVALRYAACGMPARAQRVLARYRAMTPPARRHPIALLHAADLARRLGDAEAAQRALREALSRPARGVFPFRRETAAMLRRAVRQASGFAGRWKLRLYLGTYLAWRGALGAALSQLHAAAAARPRFATLYRMLARITLVKAERARPPRRGAHQAARLAAAKLLERALSIDPGDYRVAVELDRAYDALGGRLAQRERLWKGLPASVRAHPSVLLRRALWLVQRHRYDAALAILTKHRFPPWEGWTGGRDVYLLALHGKATAAHAKQRYDEAVAALNRAMRFPENLGSGRPAKPDLARELYRIGVIQYERRNYAAAQAAYQRALRSPGGLASVSFRAAAAKELGQASRAGRMLAKAHGPLQRAFERHARGKKGHIWTYRLALVLEGLGKIADARILMKIALQRWPDFEWGRRLLRRLEQTVDPRVLRPDGDNDKRRSR